ncbi:single-stranded DNA-binding protein [Clostridium felsineum]|uniref:Single-stranded DNA-binding protein n=1 Tax=Clostridium felsineum TaxID=36839 RepID=A0A1S8KY60_9CLOT|nr:single-stranded DNA-binding protein [Clostridium felsineum]URZ05965.1 Single-stranded DNA-binding protein [Clostridium felsineum]URZ11002.1 Single-stranded DNA-binding protein [Clostridium felsineum]
MNKVVLIGRLIKDPVLKFIQGSGTAVAQFNIAVDRRFKKEGQPEADFVPIVVWGKQAESTANYISKGRLIGISGRIQTRSYDAKDGSKRYVTEIIAEEVQFLDYGSNGNTSSRGNQSGSIGLPDNNDITPIDDGDIPF